MSRRARKIRCIETGEVYNSGREAGRAIGADASLINKVVSGKLESAKGLHFVAVEENAQEGGIVPSVVQNEQGEPIPVIDSREVARMLGKKHKEILGYIEGTVQSSGHITGILPTLQKEQLTTTDYFIESSYIDASGKANKCYLCTKMGCDLLATRQNGEKGILFCAKYVKRFKEMEKELNSKSVHQYPDLAKEDELILSVVKGATPLDRATALQEYTALVTDKATAPLKAELEEQQAELTQSKAELNEKTEFIDDINDCFPFTEVKQYNKQLLRDRKDIVLSTAELNRVAADLGIPVPKIDNPIVYSPYRRVNAYPRKVWEKAYPDIKLPEKKESKKLPENEGKKLPEKNENK